MKTEADLCNLALARVGQRALIDSLTDSTTEAELCAALYPSARDSLLLRHPWPFATRNKTLALLNGVTRSGWQYAYSLPTDCLAPQYLFSGARPNSPAAVSVAVSSVVFGPITNVAQLPPLSGAIPDIAYALEANDDGDGQILVTDQDSAVLVYTAALTAVIAFPHLFAEAVAWRLAADLALSLAGKPVLAEALDRKAEVAAARAWAQANNSQGADPLPDSSFIAVRG